MIRIPRGVREEQLMEPWEVLAENRILHLFGPIVGAEGGGGMMEGRYDSFSPEAVLESMIILDSKNHEPIKLVIDSPGGFIKDGLVFYNVMQSLTSPVYTIGRFCASMAAVIFAGGAAGHRYLYQYSRIMLHLPQGGFRGDPQEMERYLAEIQKDKEALMAILKKHGCSKTREQILVDIDRDFYLSNHEAIEYGVADQIINPEIHQQLFGNLKLVFKTKVNKS